MTSSKALTAIAAVVFLFAAAEGKADAIDDCSAEKDDALRLACFDRAVVARHVGLPDTQPRTARRAGGSAPMAPIAPIVARVTAMHKVSANEIAFELDNGQVWQQLEAVTALDVRVAESVTIKPGVLGAFLMTTAQGQTFRVKRSR